jgi:hypothetical protein
MREEEERWGGGEGQLALYTMLCETGAKGEFKISSNPSDNAMTHVSLTYGQTRNERENKRLPVLEKKLWGDSPTSRQIFKLDGAMAPCQNFISDSRSRPFFLLRCNAILEDASEIISRRWSCLTLHPWHIHNHGSAI